CGSLLWSFLTNAGVLDNAVLSDSVGLIRSYVGGNVTPAHVLDVLDSYVKEVYASGADGGGEDVALKIGGVRRPTFPDNNNNNNNNNGVFAALDLVGAHASIANVASSDSLSNMMKMFYHESLAWRIDDKVFVFVVVASTDVARPACDPLSHRKRSALKHLTV
ncbi:hypothetical protein ACHAW5_010930, partial [Stephanodiscus triporus]